MLGDGHPGFAKFGQTLSNYLSQIPEAYEVITTTDQKKYTKLKDFDALVIYTHFGKLTPSQEKGLLTYVRQGGGVVAVHAAAASYKDNRGYVEMIGSQLEEHGPISEITIEHTADSSGILPRLAKSFVVTDEFYQLGLRTKDKLQPFQYGWWQSEKKMLGYVRNYGKGRVFYTALGHDERSFNHPEFKDLILKGLRYVTREPKEKSFRWGIVGYGAAFDIGKFHADHINETDGLVVTAVCDQNPARLKAAQKDFGKDVKFFSDTKKLIASNVCDGVSVAVPHNIHTQVCLPFLEEGLHVVCEKPFAITPEECDQMIQAAQDTDVMLTVYQSRHWDADMWTIREIVESGAIGEVFAIEHHSRGYDRPGQWWRSDKAVSGGLLYDMGAHAFEKSFQIIPRTDSSGQPINRRAYLFGNFMKKVWHDVTNEDYCRAYVKFDTGLEIMVTQSSISTADLPYWVISGTKGSCMSADGGIEVKSYVNGAVQTNLVPMVKGLTWQSFYRNVADHLHLNIPLVITPQLAKALIQCIHGCELAARENRLVEVEFDF